MVNKDNLNVNEFDCFKRLNFILYLNYGIWVFSKLNNFKIKKLQEIAQHWHNLAIQMIAARNAAHNLKYAVNTKNFAKNAI